MGVGGIVCTLGPKRLLISPNSAEIYPLVNSHLSYSLSGKGRGRGRSRTDEDEEGGGRPSGPSTLFDFLESKMGAFSIDGE